MKTNFKKLLICSIAATYISLLPACSSKGDKVEEIVITQLNDILSVEEHDCSAAVLSVGNALITDKDHYVSLTSIAPININSDNDSESKDAELEISFANSPIIISGLLEYNDRPAHVRFYATKIVGQDISSESFQACTVSYQLDYHFNEPCMSIREDAFKKWNQIDTLGSDNNTRYFVHMRKPNKTVYLTNIERNTQCLVSVHETSTLPI